MFPVIELRCETLALLTGWPKKVATNGPARAAAALRRFLPKR